MKLFNTYISSYIENHSTYFNDANLEGQEHVLKGIMRLILIHRNMWPRYVPRLMVIYG